jgi:hypothetical protein
VGYRANEAAGVKMERKLKLTEHQKSAKGGAESEQAPVDVGTMQMKNLASIHVRFDASI